MPEVPPIDADLGHSRTTSLPGHPVGQETASVLGGSASDQRPVTCEEESPMTASSSGQREITHDLNGIPSEFPPFVWTDSSDAESDLITPQSMSPTPRADSGYSPNAPPTDFADRGNGLLNMAHNPGRFTIVHFVPDVLPSAAGDFAEPPRLRMDTSALFGETW
jgi:hypothetical protein